ncbi:nicotinate-nucleotide adenylyltransferase [Solemya velesiana gill symbiont]|uniref:Probable nicotinate-nucleotide adenylyltransferase n=1 Tax=Solemya velesiana gill symbiont TaxID=1918948 RepID=A0A1T2KU75_9GAMM|nr:nicotinate-nucleotide adenylyltransferase [Solemya velesiana gill symbiont]OOZ36405.1 nicotinic acid mononucleotide adenylyltransferase [Solemya velesiana gill symbiont]
MIGVLGGTFDPIHYGHLRTALDVQQALGLDEIRLVPLRDPPHRDAPLTTPRQRLEMVQAAVESNPLFHVDDRELRRDGKSYSVDTLRSLRQELGDTLPICLVMGSDAFRGFADWHQPENILELAHLVIMQRPGEAPIDLYRQRITNDPAQLKTQRGGLILFQAVTQLEISATGIRSLIAKGRSPRYLLPKRVLKIIEAQGLYR